MAPAQDRTAQIGESDPRHWPPSGSGSLGSFLPKAVSGQEIPRVLSVRPGLRGRVPIPCLHEKPVSGLLPVVLLSTGRDYSLPRLGFLHNKAWALPVPKEFEVVSARAEKALSSR